MIHLWFYTIKCLGSIVLNIVYFLSQIITIQSRRGASLHRGLWKRIINLQDHSIFNRHSIGKTHAAAAGTIMSKIEGPRIHISVWPNTIISVGWFSTFLGGHFELSQFTRINQHFARLMMQLNLTCKRQFILHFSNIFIRLIHKLLIFSLKSKTNQQMYENIVIMKQYNLGPHPTVKPVPGDINKRKILSKQFIIISGTFKLMISTSPSVHHTITVLFFV